MNSFTPRSKKGPEKLVQEAVEAYLKQRDWVLRRTHGSMYQSGFPDIYCAHRRYGARWIEIKYANHYCFTPAQLEFFPLLSSAGIGIFILTAATDEEYYKLWEPPNWHQFLSCNKIVSRPRLSSKHIEKYSPKYPTPGIKD